MLCLKKETFIIASEEGLVSRVGPPQEEGLVLSGFPSWTRE